LTCFSDIFHRFPRLYRIATLFLVLLIFIPTVLSGGCAVPKYNSAPDSSISSGHMPDSDSFNSSEYKSDPADNASSGSSLNSAQNAAFDEFLLQLFRSEITQNTINLHFSLSSPASYGITDIPISLGGISGQAAEQNRAALENTVAALKHFDTEKLSKTQKLTYDILSDYLSMEQKGTDFSLYNEYLNPSSGIQAQLPVLYEEYRFYNEDDIKTYLKLLPLTGSYFEQIIDFEKEKSSAGLFMSDAVCKEVIEQCSRFADDGDDHYLILTFNKKVDDFKDLSDEQKTAYKKQNEKIVKEMIFPAYTSLASSLSSLLGSGKNEKGLCYLKRGRDYYKYLVYENTGCADSIADIETMIGQKRLSDLSEAAALTASNPDLWTDAQKLSLSSADPTSVLELLKERMQSDFPKAPDVSYSVSYIEECMEDYLAPAYYITAPIDDYNANSIYINAKTDATTMRYFTTLAHEGFPGHLYQTIMSYQSGLPAIRSILNYPGYVEGWATYVEMMSYHYAGLPDDTATLLALNQSALLSLYASTDIGIHHDGWSLSDTIKFWNDYGISDPDTIAEIYRYIISEPANYLRYYVGYLQFLELKEYAKETLGNDYNEAAFHQTLLSIGPAPFEIVKKYLKEFYQK
jgi:uncharacterized protein (DUF885 family)